MALPPVAHGGYEDVLLALYVCAGSAEAANEALVGRTQSSPAAEQLAGACKSLSRAAGPGCDPGPLEYCIRVGTTLEGVTFAESLIIDFLSQNQVTSLLLKLDLLPAEVPGPSEPVTIRLHNPSWQANQRIISAVATYETVLPPIVGIGILAGESDVHAQEVLLAAEGHTTFRVVGLDASGKAIGPVQAHWLIAEDNLRGTPVSALRDCGDLEGTATGASATRRYHAPDTATTTLPGGGDDACTLRVAYQVPGAPADQSLLTATLRIVTREVATIQIAGPASVHVNDEDAVEFAADVYDADGNALLFDAEEDLAWSIEPAAGGTFDGASFMHDELAGDYTVKVTFQEGVFATHGFVVEPDTLVTFTLTCPPTPVVVDTSVSCTVSDGRDADGRYVPLGPAAWTVTDADGAELDVGNGAFTAPKHVASGPLVVSAAIDGIEKTAEVALAAAALAKIIVSGPDALVAGSTAEYALQGEDAHGNDVALDPATIAFTAPTAIGNADVCASQQGITGCKTVSVVADALDSIAVSGPDSLVADKTGTFTPSGKDRHNNPVTLPDATFEHRAKKAAGSDEACYQVGDVTGCKTFTVVADALAKITVAGPDEVVADKTATFTPSGFDQFDNPVTLADATFEHRASTLAGDDEACYTGGDVTGCKTFTVVADALAKINVAGPEEVVADKTATFTPSGFDQFDNAVTLADATFEHRASTLAGDDQACYTEGAVTGCKTFTVVADALASFVLTCAATRVGDETTCSVSDGKDQFDNPRPIGAVFWTATDARGDEVNIVDGTFTAPAHVERSPVSVGAIATGVPRAQSVELTVRPLARFAVDCGGAVELGRSATCVAQAEDEFGNDRDEAPSAWSAEVGGFSTSSGKSTTYFPPGQAGTYTVTARLASVTGSTDVIVNPGTLARLEVVPDTTTVSADVAQTAIRVIARDGLGNALGAGQAVELSIAANATNKAGGTASLSATSGITGADGSFTVTLTTTRAAGDVFRVIAMDDAEAPSVIGRSPFISVVPGVPAAIDLVCVPADCAVKAGVAVSIELVLADAYGNHASGAAAFDGARAFVFSGASLAPNGEDATCTDSEGGAVDHGAPTTLSFANGRAATTCVFYAAGAVTLNAVQDDIEDATPLALSVAAGDAAKLLLDAPATAVSGSGFGATACIADAWHNLLPGASATVALKTTATPTDADPAILATLETTTGCAAFVGVTLARAGDYTLAADAGETLTGASQALVLVHGPAHDLRFVGLPEGPLPVTSEAAFTLQVEVVDAAGNRVLDSEAPVTLAESHEDAQLLGTLTRDAIAGLATFSGLSIARAVPLIVEATGVGDGASAEVDVAPGAPKSLAFVAIPPVEAGDEFALAVKVLDNAGNLVDTATTTITLELGETIVGQQDAVGGIATFSSLELTLAATHTFLAAAAGLGEDSLGVIVVPADAAKLVFIGNPAATVVAGACTAFMVQTQDEFGNAVVGERTLTLPSGAFSPDGCTEEDAVATLDIAPEASAATFRYRNTVATGAEPLALQVTSGTLTAANHPLAVAADEPVAYELTCAVTCEATAGAPLALRVRALDQFGNTAAVSGAQSLTFSGAAAAPGGQIPSCVGSEDGFVFAAGETLVACTFYNAETPTLQVSGALTSATRAISVAPGEAATYDVVRDGSGSIVTGGTVTFVVTAYDAYGNVATSYDGEKPLVFGGALPAPNGAKATAAGVDFGLETAITFDAGVASVPVVLRRNETVTVTLAHEVIAGTAPAVQVATGPATGFVVARDCTVAEARLDAETCVSASASKTRTDAMREDEVPIYRAMLADAFENILGATTGSQTSWDGAGDAAELWTGAGHTVAFAPMGTGSGTITVSVAGFANRVFYIEVSPASEG